jgi:hypothetical protein
MATKKNGRPANAEAAATLEVTGVEPKLIEYLKVLKGKQGFGNSLSAIARGFIWNEVNRLIKDGRLKEK